MYLIIKMYRHINIDLPRHKLFLLGREFQAKLCPGVCTECSLPAPRAAHTRLPSCKHTHSAQALAAPRAFLPRERAPSLAFCGSLDSTLYIIVDNTSAAHTRLPSCKHTHRAQSLAAPRTAHTRLPSCKHTHSAQALTAPRAFHPRERAPNLALCGSLDSTFCRPCAGHERH